MIFRRRLGTKRVGLTIRGTLIGEILIAVLGTIAGWLNRSQRRHQDGPWTYQQRDDDDEQQGGYWRR